MKLRPLFDRVLLKPIMSSTMSKSGLLIAMEEEKTSKAIVHTLGIGDGVAKANLKEGDTVLYNKYAGESYKFEKIEYLLLDVTEITAVLEEE